MSDTDLPPDAPWWARWLVANISEAWKWASVWWPAFCAAAAEVYAQNQEQINQFIEAHIPVSWRPHLVAAVFVVAIFLRVVKFTKGKT